MAAKKGTAENADEGQALPPGEDDVLAAAQAIRAKYHEDRGHAPTKDWDDLPEAKQQRWIDLATGSND